MKKIQEEVSDIGLFVRSHGREEFPSTFEAGLSQKVNPIFRKRDNRDTFPDVITAAFRKVSLSGAVLLLMLLLYNMSAGNNNILRNFLDDQTTTMKLAYDPSAQPLWTDTK